MKSMEMRKTVLAATICLTTLVTVMAAEKQPQPPSVRVAVDPRVELFSIIFRLAGNEEYTRGRVESYVKDVDAHFGRYQKHPAVEKARQLRQKRGISFDAPMSMAVHLTDAIKLEPKAPLNPWPATLDRRWKEKDAQEFLEAARQFVRDTSYQEFFEKHRPLYEVTESRMRALLDKEAHWQWFGDFFGQKSAPSFTVTFLLLTSGNCYGPSFQPAQGEKEFYCVLGVWKTDREGQPKFTDDILPILIHEFCHSYANGFVDRHASELKAASEKLYAPLASAMQSQNYGHPKTLLYESMVRALVVRYVARYGGPEAAQKTIAEEKLRKFLWVGELSDRLKEYELHRDQYPDLDAFAPEIVRFFNEYADTFNREYKEQQRTLDALFEAEQKKPRPELKALDGTAPKVVSVIPADGDRNVDPALKAIVVVFDRPMRDKRWSLCGNLPDTPPFPPTAGDCAYDSSRSIWIVPLKLEADKEYSFMLNYKETANFMSQDGVPLDSVKVTFKTAKEGGNRKDANNKE